MKKSLITSVFKKDERILFRNAKETGDDSKETLPQEWVITNTRLIIKNPNNMRQDEIMTALGFPRVEGNYAKADGIIQSNPFPDYDKIIPQPNTEQFPCYKFKDTNLYCMSDGNYIKILKLANDQYAYINANYYKLLDQISTGNDILISGNRAMMVHTFDGETIDKSKEFIIAMMMQPDAYDCKLGEYLVNPDEAVEREHTQIDKELDESIAEHDADAEEEKTEKEEEKPGMKVGI